MFVCPLCKDRLVRSRGDRNVFWTCSSCQGRAASISMLRRTIVRDFINQLWLLAREGKGDRNRPCPACEQPMVTVSLSDGPPALWLDVCTRCQFVWFDPKEFEQMPSLPPLPTEEQPPLPQEARELLARHQAELIAERADVTYGRAPDQGWKMLPAVLGMPVEQKVHALERLPWLTWALAATVSLASLFAFLDLERVVNDFGLIPAEAGRYGGLTLLTSFLLHGGFFHLIGNLYFLVIFGDDVEDYLGKGRYLLVVLVAALAGSALHIAPNPDSPVPVIGASGGISALIAFYGLQFPQARLGFWLGYPLFRWIRMRAFVALILWILIQSLGAWRQVTGVTQVSFLAHLGGATAGLLFWLLWRENRPKG